MTQRSRDRIRQMQQQQQKQRARRRNLTVAAVVVLILFLVVGVGVAVQMNRSGTAVGTAGTPQGTVDKYAIPRGDASAPVTLTLYEDFQCPICRTFETVLAGTIDDLVSSGTVRVEYHPIAFLDDASTTNYSSRALNAAACVLDHAGRDHFLQMHNLLYANQPAEGTAGLTDQQLLDLASRAGTQPGEVRPCIEQQRFLGWTQAATERASIEGVNATPTILVNGKQLQFTQGQDPITTLRQAVQAAAGD